MVGRLLANRRSGNLAEELGILLLKSIAAVADVPRPEDIGFDAVANLLRRDSDGCFYAEDGFAVQIKSESEKTTECKDHALEWLLAQSLPLFIGKVSLEHGSISLFPTIHVNQAALAWHPTHAVVHYAESNLPPFLQSEKHSRWSGSRTDGKTVSVWIGPPIVTWGVADLRQVHVLARTYQILKQFLAIARRERELLGLGQCSVIEWKTNDLDSIQVSVGMMKGGPGDFQNLVEKLEPIFNSLLLNATSLPFEKRGEIVESALSLIRGIKSAGFEIGTGKFFELLGTTALHDFEEQARQDET